jgi:hypothetical protein
MTDWDRITEEIQGAMQALDLAHEAGENLKRDASPKTVDEFKQQVDLLYEHLRDLKAIWEHEYEFSMDEFGDVLSQLLSGKPAAYRSSHRFQG